MIHNILKACVTVAAKKDTRVYLNAVHIRKNHDGKLVIEASDGHVSQRPRIRRRSGKHPD